jgi:hypothetical protein
MFGIEIHDTLLKYFSFKNVLNYLFSDFFFIFNISTSKPLENTKNINFFFQIKYIFKIYSNIISKPKQKRKRKTVP